MRPPVVAARMEIDGVALGGGLDLVSGWLDAEPGSCRYASNYEAMILGGYERVGGYERFDGRARPSDGTYTISVPVAPYTGVAVGNTVTGGTSGVTGKVVYVDAAGWIAVTRMTGVFTVGETLLVGAAPIGVHTAGEVAIDGFLDNTIMGLVAAEYRASIGKPPGQGPIRGVAVLGTDVFAWRDNVGATAMVIYRATAAGWVAVQLYHYVDFTGGTTAYTPGGSLVQGGNSSTVMAVMLESGLWSTGNAAGRMIVTAPTPSNFVAGAATGTGVATLAGPATAITLAPGGRVETDTFNFFGSASARRLYGCDGVNDEFEFDGTVYAPLKTGMAGIARASFVKAHKNFLWFAYKGSLQKSGAGNPYAWSAIFGAAELATGDTITGLVSVGGSEAAAALIVPCQNSTHVLYGSSSADFKLSPLSFEAGANPYSVQDVGRVMAHDTQGFRDFTPTQSFGNFTLDIKSNKIEPLVREKTPSASVFVKGLGRYRCFFNDGTAVTGTPWKRGYAWMPVQLAHQVVVATSAEVGGVSRTFYGTSDGWVMEADVGRSFDGADVTFSMRLSTLFKKTPTLIKQYRKTEIEAVGRSAFELKVGVQYRAADTSQAEDVVVDLQALRSFGQPLIWGGASWGAAYWGSGSAVALRLDTPGQGVGAAPLIGGASANELPHQVKTVMMNFSPRRLVR